MKLKCNVVISEAGGETLAIPMEKSFNGVIRVNGTAGFILECLKKETSEEKIVSQLVKKYDVTPEKASADLEKILDKLEEAGILDR